MLLPSTISECEDEDINDTSSREESTARTGDKSAFQTEGEKNKEIRDAIIRSEEAAVRKTRLLVGITVVICAVGIVLAVYFLARQSDLRSFELQVRPIVFGESRHVFPISLQRFVVSTSTMGSPRKYEHWYDGKFDTTLH
jgi:hypothetical protein